MRSGRLDHAPADRHRVALDAALRTDGHVAAHRKYIFFDGAVDLNGRANRYRARNIFAGANNNRLAKTKLRGLLVGQRWFTGDAEVKQGQREDGATPAQVGHHWVTD